MGYIYRLGKVPKIEKEKIDGLNETEVINLLNDRNLARPKIHTELYELGRWLNFDKKYFSPFYSFNLEEEEFWIVGKDFLSFLIENYRLGILDEYSKYLKVLTKYYNKEIIESTDEADLAMCISNVNSKVAEWGLKFGLCPYYLDESDDRKDGKLARSWKYEYAIFNLISIYQDFNFNDDYLILSAW